MIYVVAAVLGVIVFFIVICIAITIVTGRGEIQTFNNTDGTIVENSIAERDFVDINGKENGMIIRGKSLDNPVLLFISGGPGVPEYWLNEFYDNKIEDYYTVCWWDWYGEGLSYKPNISKEDLTTERLALDAVEVAKYLKERFGKEKIYLMAHSGGTPLGLYLAETDAEDFYCYFSMGQYVNENDSRYTAGYAYLESYFMNKNDTKDLATINALMEEDSNGVMRPKDPSTISGKWESLLLRAGCGTTREVRSDAFDIFFPEMFSKCYTFREKINYWNGKVLNTGTPYHNESLGTSTKKTQIPVYFISGKYDYTCPVTLVEELYQNLDAPDKGFYIYNESAHSPLWEENEKVLNQMQELTNRLE